MKDKTKNSIKTVIRYIRDLSIVIAGIAVTLYLDSLVTNQSEKRDLQLYFNAIKLELEENMEILDEAIENMEQSVRYSDYLRSHDPDTLDKDTINSFAHVYNGASAYTYKTNAFEMFKNSGSMRLVEDKQLLLSLWDVYSDLEDRKISSEFLFNQSWEEMMRELTLKVDGQPIKFASQYKFYVAGFHYSLLRDYKESLEKVREFVLILEKESK